MRLPEGPAAVDPAFGEEPGERVDHRGFQRLRRRERVAKSGHLRRVFGMKEVDVRVKGPGSGRESAITAMQSAGLNIKSIEDVTPLPHNGCRPPKKRRV